MHFDVFATGDSIFHRLDPRVKIVALLPLIFMIAITDNFLIIYASLLLSTIFILLSFLPFRLLLNRILMVNIFLLMLWVILPLTATSETFVVIFGLSLSYAGIAKAYLITLKANSILLSTVALLATTEKFALAHTLFHLRCPKKLVYLLFFIYRYMSLLHIEFEKLQKATRIRSFEAKANIHTFKHLSYLMGGLFIKSYDRSERAYNALKLRGFRGDFPVLHHPSYKISDWIFLTLMLTFFGLVMLL
ncbi:MAG: cobalt ECF transporter T component CbiQ [Nitrospinota bacterium]